MEKELFEEINKLLYLKGYTHHQGQTELNNKVNEVHHFIKDRELVEILIESEADEEILEAIKGDDE